MFLYKPNEGFIYVQDLIKLNYITEKYIYNLITIELIHNTHGSDIVL